jgi:hypothetical protein
MQNLIHLLVQVACVQSMKLSVHYQGFFVHLGINENFSKIFPCGEKFLLVLMGGRADRQACADLGTRTHISASEHFPNLMFKFQYFAPTYTFS